MSYLQVPFSNWSKRPNTNDLQCIELFQNDFYTFALISFVYLLWLSVQSMCFSMYFALVADEERVRTYPDIRPAKEIAAIEQRAGQRVTIVEEMWQQKEVVQQERVGEGPALREVEDNWYILLDVAPRESGIIHWNQAFAYQFELHNISSNPLLVCALTNSQAIILFIPQFCLGLFHCPCKLCCISTIIPGYVFVLVFAPEHIQFPADARVPPPAAAAAAAKTRTIVSERRPQFEKRILEERHPAIQSQDSDNWFVLMDGDLKESGILSCVWV